MKSVITKHFCSPVVRILHVIFEDWESTQLIYLMPMAHVCYKFRTESQLVPRTQHIRKNLGRVMCSWNTFPSSHSKGSHAAAPLAFSTFVRLTSWPGGCWQQGDFHPWVTGWDSSWIQSSSINPDSSSRTQLTRRTNQGLLTYITYLDSFGYKLSHRSSAARKGIRIGNLSRARICFTIWDRQARFSVMTETLAN